MTKVSAYKVELDKRRADATGKPARHTEQVKAGVSGVAKILEDAEKADPVLVVLG
jgi:hypothetical protein